MAILESVVADGQNRVGDHKIATVAATIKSILADSHNIVGDDGGFASHKQCAVVSGNDGIVFGIETRVVFVNRDGLH